jgi:hypothetical protein
LSNSWQSIASQLQGLDFLGSVKSLTSSNQKMAPGAAEQGRAQARQSTSSSSSRSCPTPTSSCAHIKEG